VLSARLGLGSGNLSWAPPDLLASSLGVDPGCVTPLGLANAGSCGRVVALLDGRLRAPAARFFVHPIVNDVSVLIDAAGLDAFLRWAPQGGDGGGGGPPRRPPRWRGLASARVCMPFLPSTNLPLQSRAVTKTPHKAGP
jgi:hypothetical protein